MLSAVSSRTMPITSNIVWPRIDCGRRSRRGFTAALDPATLDKKDRAALGALGWSADEDGIRPDPV